MEVASLARDMPYERAEGRELLLASVIHFRTDVYFWLVRGTVEVRLQRRTVGEFLVAPRALPSPTDPRALGGLLVVQPWSNPTPVRDFDKEPDIEKRAVGVGEDESVVHRLAVDSRGARSRLPVRDEVAFVEEGFGAERRGACMVASIVDGGVEMSLKVCL